MLALLPKICYSCCEMGVAPLYCYLHLTNKIYPCLAKTKTKVNSGRQREGIKTLNLETDPKYQNDFSDSCRWTIGYDFRHAPGSSLSTKTQESYNCTIQRLASDTTYLHTIRSSPHFSALSNRPDLQPMSTPGHSLTH
jgi:hypothetical protein